MGSKYKIGDKKEDFIGRHDVFMTTAMQTQCINHIKTTLSRHFAYDRNGKEYAPSVEIRANRRDSIRRPTSSRKDRAGMSSAR